MTATDGYFSLCMDDPAANTASEARAALRQALLQLPEATGLATFFETFDNQVFRYSEDAKQHSVWPREATEAAVASLLDDCEGGAIATLEADMEPEDGAVVYCRLMADNFINRNGYFNQLLSRDLRVISQAAVMLKEVTAWRFNRLPEGTQARFVACLHAFQTTLQTPNIQRVLVMHAAKKERETFIADWELTWERYENGDYEYDELRGMLREMINRIL